MLQEFSRPFPGTCAERPPVAMYGTGVWSASAPYCSSAVRCLHTRFASGVERPIDPPRRFRSILMQGECLLGAAVCGRYGTV
ncbi:hypothetical protein RRG08_057109 [Elysia crispata]|uniref:Uncharacterized protein n=1 Tax=Elysia crispata TaxID=231223 RepID=A0AAE1B848_9GAST|nr:hypothetical protein RRG08_057109 [Elysia crispata]